MRFDCKYRNASIPVFEILLVSGIPPDPETFKDLEGFENSESFDDPDGPEGCESPSEDPENFEARKDRPGEEFPEE